MLSLSDSYCTIAGICSSSYRVLLIEQSSVVVRINCPYIFSAEVAFMPRNFKAPEEDESLCQQLMNPRISAEFSLTFGFNDNCVF